MKLSCCPILVILILAVLTLQIWIIRLLPTASPATTSTSPLPSPTPVNTVSVAPSPSPVSAPESKLLFERNNIAACGFTDTSTFPLKEAYIITKLQTWYSWESNEITLDYQLKRGSQIIHQGVLVRKDCDPYQRQWCQAVEENLSLKLDAGDYQLVADTKKICQNSGSGNDGFIFVYGQ